mmetsp:Transcript_102259/g.259720  ORF Transcript_102259/g.259720 Transcript_102259/m.259720 type:complete len:384 (+) Transcript_102259:72-1223(+)
MAETRAQNARLTVKNTFFVWEDEDIDAQAARSCRRALSTCPDMGRAVSFLCEDEPDAAISPSGSAEPTPRDAPVGFAVAAEETDDVAVQLRLSDRRHTRGGCRGLRSQATALRGPELAQVSDVPRITSSHLEESEDRTHINADQRVVAARGQRQGHRRIRRELEERASLSRCAIEHSQPQQAHEQNNGRMVWSRSVAGHANAVGQSSSSGSQNLGSAGSLNSARPPKSVQHRANMRGRLWCHLHISPEMWRPGFCLNKRIIGRGGECTRGIFEATGAKIRLRGHGSGHLEENGKEAKVPLMLAVTGVAGQPANFCTAVRMVVELLRDIEERFRAFCQRQDKGRSHSGRESSNSLFLVGDISLVGRMLAAALLESLSLALPELA